MKKPRVPFLFLLVMMMAVLVTNAQKKESYKSLQKRSSVSSVARLLESANSLKTTNPKEALNNVEDALAMSLAQNDLQSEGKCYLLIAEINEGIQEWKLALENYHQAYQKFTEANEGEEELVKALRGIGAMNLKLANYNDALNYFQQALAQRVNSKDKSEILLDISEVYFQMKKYTEALQALDDIPVTKMANSSIETRKQNQRAKIYVMTNNFEKTQDIFSNSINSVRSGNKADAQQEVSFKDTKEEIANVLKDQKRYDDEIAIRKQSIDYNLQNKNAAEVANDKVAIGKTLEAKGEKKEALKELQGAAAIADTINNPKQQAQAYLALAQLYERNQSAKEALVAYRKYADAVSRSDQQKETRLLEKSELIKKQKDIEGLSNFVSLSKKEETIKEQTVFRQQLVIYGLLLILAITSITSYFIYKNAKASKLANQLLVLKSLRSQMNPHFIFNALNSVNHFIAQQDERAANKFLSEFSQLMRLVLENSQEDFIPFQTEQEILSLYLKLEHYRFRDKFDYEIVNTGNINAENNEVPPMLLQPYLENAIWHGLRYKETKGKLTVRFSRDDQDIVVDIEDDGIGRAKSAAIKTENQKKHKSTGLKNIRERLLIINNVYKTNYRVQTDDLPDGTGTLVRIHLPYRNSKNNL